MIKQVKKVKLGTNTNVVFGAYLQTSTTETYSPEILQEFENLVETSGKKSFQKQIKNRINNLLTYHVLINNSVRSKNFKITNFRNMCSKKAPK
jgi:hypothetical protein